MKTDNFRKVLNVVFFERGTYFSLIF